MHDRRAANEARIATTDPSTIAKTWPHQARHRALNEIEHLRAHQGPGVVPLLAVTDDHGEITLALAAADCSVADVIAERGPLPAAEVTATVRHAAAALTRLHRDKTIHGDVKPANLLLATGELWLADFDAAGPDDGSRPERGSRASSRDPRRVAGLDWCALAVTTVELATGTLIDPSVDWHAADLRALGCSAPIAELAVRLFDADDVDSDQLFAGLGLAEGCLPTAVAPRRHDPTPTIEFMAPPGPSPAPMVPVSMPWPALAALGGLVLIVVTVWLVG